MEGSGAVPEVDISSLFKDKLVISYEDMEGCRNAGDRIVIDVDRFEAAPTNYIRGLYEQRSASSSPIDVWEREVLNELHLAYVKRRFDPDGLLPVWSLNNKGDQGPLKNGQVVRFRCMFQDHVSDEYISRECNTADPECEDTRVTTTLLMASRDCYDEVESKSWASKDVFVAISPPGESAWTADLCNTVGVMDNQKDGTVAEGVRKKIKMLDDQHAKEVILPVFEKENPTLFAAPMTNHHQRSAAYIKIYKHQDDEAKEPTVNVVYDVIGILEMNVDVTEEEAEYFGHAVYKNLPIIHAFSVVPLAGGNPRVPIFEKKLCPFPKVENYSSKELTKTLRDVLAKALGGDQYAAAYAMVALASRGWKKSRNGDGETVGNVVLNITGVSAETDLLANLEMALSELLPRVVKLDFTIENMNNVQLTPKKNMNSERLETTFLQLPVETVLIINETGLKEGQFNENGTKNIRALDRLLKTQTVKYEYPFMEPEISANFPIIIISDQPSVIHHDVHIPLKPVTDDAELKNFPSYIRKLMDESKGQAIRNYLTLLREEQHVLKFDPEDKAVQEDLIEYMVQRNNSPPEVYKTKMTKTTMSAFTVAVRVWSLMQGSKYVTREALEAWKSFEQVRDSRLPAPISNAATSNNRTIGQLETVHE